MPFSPGHDEQFAVLPFHTLETFSAASFPAGVDYDEAHVRYELKEDISAVSINGGFINPDNNILMVDI